MSAREKAACLFGFGLEAGLLLLALVSSGGVHETQQSIAVFFVTSVLYLAGLAFMCRLDGGIRPSFLLGWALLFRLTAFWMPPLFSDDLFRYRWEGQVAAAGFNPYEVRPIDPQVVRFFDERVDGKDIRAVYGPLLQLVQLTLVQMGAGSLHVMKLGACLAELALCWLLWQWLPTEKWRWIAWAWCPLGIVEFWGMGHHDAIMVALTAAAIWFAEQKRWPWAMALLGLAGATKYWPLLLILPFARQGGWRWLWLPPAISAALWWPWWTDILQNARYTGGYIGGWRNNDALFGFLLSLTGNLDTAKYLAAGLILASAIAAAVWARTPRQAYWTIALTILLVSANAHPWYLTWILPFAVFSWPSPVLLWAALVPIHYIVLIRWREEHVWEGVSPWRWIVYLPVLAAMMVQVIRRPRVGNPRS
jgi:alpha-1,6-mannosyltransferase